MDKPTKPPTPDEEADLALLVAYWRQLQQNEFYGVVTITASKGEMKHLRQDETRPPPALATDLWDKLPEKVKPALRKRFKDSTSFSVEE